MVITTECNRRMQHSPVNAFRMYFSPISKYDVSLHMIKDLDLTSKFGPNRDIVDSQSTDKYPTIVFSIMCRNPMSTTCLLQILFRRYYCIPCSSTMVKLLQKDLVKSSMIDSHWATLIQSDNLIFDKISMLVGKMKYIYL